MGRHLPADLAPALLELQEGQSYVVQPASDLQGKWRRRESNPRPRTHRKERLQACPAIWIRPPAGSQAAHRRASHPLESRSGQLALPRRQARCWRRIPSHGPKTERRRYLTRLGSECEIVLRTCFVPGCFTRPTGDLGLQLFRRTDHVETRSPPSYPNYILGFPCPGGSS